MKAKVVVLGTALFVVGVLMLWAVAQEAESPAAGEQAVEEAKGQAVEVIKEKAEEIVKKEWTAEEQGTEAEPPAIAEQQAMMKERMEMMRKAGVSEAMIHGWRAMVGMPIYLDSPFAIAGQASDLGLTAEQTQKLMDIQKEARQKTMELLTAEQQAKVGKVSEAPMTMMEICKAMHGNQAVISEMEKCKDAACKCPMCPMMKKQTTKLDEVKRPLVIE